MNPSSALLQMRQDAESIFHAGVQAVDPKTAVKRHLRIEDRSLFVGSRRIDLDAVRHLYLVGAGKATAPMAAAVEDLLADHIRSGVISIKYGHGVPLQITKTREGAHPIPDENSQRASEEILSIAHQAGKQDLIICLISGGGSALLAHPVADISLADKQAAVALLLRCGADIHEINTVRKHISAVKGGRLARAAAPASVISLILSDVIGDDLDVIASGPTVGDPTTYADARDVICRYGLADRIPRSVLDYLKKGESGKFPDTPTPEDPIFCNNDAWIIGSNATALDAAAEQARRFGYQTVILSSMISGDTRETARFHAAIAKESRISGNPIAPPACILSGGETTVQVEGTGKGGRNQEFSLAFAKAVAGTPDIVVLSAGTDGTDGPTDAAGAFADGDTVARSKLRGLDLQRHQARNDAYHFFEALGDLFITGPTRTNVMDLRIILIR